VLSLLGVLERECGAIEASREHMLMTLSLTPGDWRPLAQLMVTVAAAGDAEAVQSYQHQLETVMADQIPHARVYALEQYGIALHVLGATREAIAEYERARALLGEADTVAAKRLSANLSLELGEAYREIGDHEAAERELERAFAEMHALFPAVGPAHANVLRSLGELALDRERYDEARTYLEQAASICLATAEPDFLPLARTRFALARAMTGADETASAEARALAEAALVGLYANHKADEARTVAAWLDEHSG
jgi:tetratricopeptide (TPR) repeat protein